MHLEKQIKIEAKTQVGTLFFDKAFTKVSADYSNYSNVFSAKNVVKLLKHSKMNNYAIKLEKSKQLSFSPIYNLGLIELEFLKIYIKTNLVNDFI